MDRALDLDTLATALGGRTELPSAAELQRLLADAELALLVRTSNMDKRLLRTAWYLHGVASATRAPTYYGTERVRVCFRVAAHIFDIALRSNQFDRKTSLQIGFAAQVGYINGELDPNAVALYRRDLRPLVAVESLLSDPELASLCCATALLGMDLRFVIDETAGLRDEIASLVDLWGVRSYSDTIYGTAAAIPLAVRAIAAFLLYGRTELLQRSQQILARALQDELIDGDRVSRWIAHHLLRLSDNLQSASLWTALPPDVPSTVRRAFSLTAPRVLTLWPSQLDVLHGTNEEGSGTNLLSADARRIFLAMPTSGGKSLLAQLMVADHVSRMSTGVCYVTPTRTLCREVRVGLDRRLR